MLGFVHYADYPQNWSSTVPLPPNSVDSWEFTVVSSSKAHHQSIIKVQAIYSVKLIL